MDSSILIIGIVGQALPLAFMISALVSGKIHLNQ